MRCFFDGGLISATSAATTAARGTATAATGGAAASARAVVFFDVISEGGERISKYNGAQQEVGPLPVVFNFPCRQDLFPVKVGNGGGCNHTGQTVQKK